MACNLSTIHGHAIVEILKEDKDRKFFVEFKLDNGDTKRLTIDIPSSGLYDTHFSQGVSLAKVVATGDDVHWITPGETVIVDYTIDTDKAKIISNEDGVKWVRANAVNKFYEKDKLISATNETRFDTYEYRKGDLESAATIFGVIRGDEILPNYPYIILKYVDLKGEFEMTETGLLVPSSEGEMVIRQVLFSHPDSPMKPGENVLVEYSSLYEREIKDEVLSICMHNDIIGRLN